MPKRGYAFALAVLVGLGVPFGSGVHGVAAAQAKHFKFDRMRATEEFLDAFYPGLRGRNGQLTFEVEEWHLSGSPVYIDFAECHVGSGVPGGARPQPPIHYCPVPTGGLPDTQYLLRAKVVLGSWEKFQVAEFSAHGELVSPKLDALVDRIKQSRGWTKNEVFDALEHGGAKFGPEQGEALFKQVPVQLVRQFSGCELDLSKAQFHSERERYPPDVRVYASIFWEIPGTRKTRIYGTRRHTMNDCYARFEPFEGNLIAIYARQ